MDSIKEISIESGVPENKIRFQIRNLEERNLVSQVYVFQKDDKTIETTSYKEALKYGVRSIEKSYYILKDPSGGEE